MEDESKFLQAGSPLLQKKKFLEKTMEVMREADVEDKEVAKDKRKEKRLKHKMREREMVRTIFCLFPRKSRRNRSVLD